jgi:two-component system CheB/CheR fusion protein
MPPTESGAMSDAPVRHAADPDPPTCAAPDFPVVGIAASAGGVQALQTFLRAMPADCGMAFVVVVNHAPRRGSQLPAILRAVTSMPVLSPAGRVTLERSHVYVVAPHKQLAMSGSALNVAETSRSRSRQAPIDLFFRTLAAAHRGHAFAVVLSGTGSDGAVGITRVKEEGGVSFAQLPQEAEFDDMPRSAIATGAVDWVLPAAELAQKLVALWANARTMQLPDAAPPPPRAEETPAPEEEQRSAEDALRDVLMLLRTRTGHDFRNYKRATVLRRLERRMQVNGVPSVPAYRSFMQANPEESQALLKDLLIGVTNFFRDAEAFEQLHKDVLPGLVAAAEGAPEGVRVWVPGCSTGEEAYSLAMMLCEQAAQAPHAASIHLFATDIDESAIGMARLGTYPSAIEADVSPVRLRRYFDKDGHQYRIRKEVREKLMFAAHDILRDPPFSRLDLVSCRNLLIYLNREVHADILRMFHFALKPGGYLFLGSSESADTASHLFTVVDKKNRIYRANLVTRPSRYVSGLLASAEARTKRGGGAEPPPGKPTVTIADLHRRLAEQYAPPSVLVDRDGHIVHLYGQAGRFLRYAGGTPTHELLGAIDPELRLELRTAMFQAARSGKSVEARRVRVQREGRGHYVTMIVRPVLEDGVEQPLSMVLFDEVEDSMSPELHVAEADGRDPLVAQLEEELRRMKEQLQTTIEHSDTSTEELRASNEELQAINQELRSATEELETSKEELQSINEELVTVNNELKCKVEETGKINDDLQNLITSTDIATVFVDRNMAIKRYTPQACRLFNLIPTDVGRSLLDITHKLDYGALATDAADAFQSLKHIEREIRSQDGLWYLARVLPYRTTEDHRIDGAVLTFIDITGRRRAEDLMRSVAVTLGDAAVVTFAPLNQIQLSTELLSGAPQAVERAAQAIRAAVQAQARILDDLLDLSRAHTSRLPLQRSVFDLRVLMEPLVQGLQAEADARQLTLRLVVPQQPLWLHADRARVEQIAWNLLDNALKFTPARGRVELVLAAADALACLQVRDSGRGIAPEQLPQVFDLVLPPPGKRRRQAGLGIGLALVRQLVLAHGGHVEATSEGLRRGSRFTVWLPLTRRGVPKASQ